MIKNKIKTERTLCKKIKCKSVGHIIAKCPKAPKDKGKQRKTVRFNERDNLA